MASSKRLINAVGAFPKTPSTPYVCAACRSTVPSRSRYQVRHNSDIPFTEKVRRKIWGTDSPPGLKDPYGGPSFLERRLAQRKQAQQQRGQQPVQLEQPEPEQPQWQHDSFPGETPSRLSARHSPTMLDRSDPKQYEPEEYQEATSWDGLEWVGHKGEYQFMESNQADDCMPWLAPTTGRALGEQELWDALHESIFDAVQPAEEAYDRETTIHVTTEGFVARAEEGASGIADAFMTAKLDFKDPKAPTFKILKNFQKVTNIRLLDPTLNKLSQNPNTTFHDLVTELLEAQKPKPKGTHDRLIVNHELVAQGNVRIASRRVSPVDKEREIGRWKVIQRELEERGLPVLGRAKRTRNLWAKKDNVQ